MELNEYFQSYDNYFWEWRTDDHLSELSIIYFPNVMTTVAYRPYIIEILKEIQLQGWPPFGSLLLVLYVTQDKFADIESLFSELNRYVERTETKELLAEAIELLKKLYNLPEKYTIKQNKITLLLTVFSENRIGVSYKNAEQLYDRYIKKPSIIEECTNKRNFNYEIFRKDIRTLAYINRKFSTTESIIDAMKGFGEIVDLEDEVVEEETTVETNKDFIQELIEEPKTFQVGSLIKRIWSGLKISMRHLSPGEQPIGGVSDMTNKGDFSRMLLSEFANEDEVFMNRVANNEALYIQREIPPEENVFERIILIDTSLKNWGTPKVLAFASAIAVIKHPKAHSECKVFALGQDSIPIKLDQVEEVIDHLNIVSPVLEVSQSLEKFLSEEHTEKDLEIFFITHQENLENQKLQKVIHENRDRLKFLVATSAEGELNFYKHHKGTRKHIQKIALPLKELWANPPKRNQKGKNNKSLKSKKADVPLNYPILFPISKNRIATFLYEGEFFILSSKKQLLKTYLSDNYYNKNYYDQYKIHRGCEVLFENISVRPKGQFALAKNKQQQFILCHYQPDKKLISKLNLNTKEYSELNLSGHKIPHQHKLIYFDKNFYLHQIEIPYNYRINIDGDIFLEETFDKINEMDKNSSKVETELNKLNNIGVEILNNFNNVGINTEFGLVISNNELTKNYDNSLVFYRNKYPIKIFAQQNKNRFTFSEGSEIITDSRGMLTFKSSNQNIPEFYIPSTETEYLALASYTEFGGSEYYLPETTLLKIRKMEDMILEYIEPFIHQIVEYGTEN
ncbi:hypothetical protein AB4Y90_07440 [Chryseobacterium sp. 2TAF14]|uniref:hypothetical protein n=1 Tax=Chryseobacterium sp. 2TAF14 TaxID=3233007 RepID=UPI003F92CB3A